MGYRRSRKLPINYKILLSKFFRHLFSL